MLVPHWSTPRILEPHWFTAGTPSQIIQCMRSKPVYDLTAALGKANLAATGAVWCVVIDGDEISGYPSDLLKAGKFTKNIPILAGIGGI